MQINTRTNRLILTKNERACLDKAATIISGIAKHADGKAQDEAAAAFESLDQMLDALAAEETVTV